MRRCDLMDFMNDHNPIFADVRPEKTESRAQKVMGRVIREHLTDKQRTCIGMYYGRNMNLEEIGRELSIDKSTVSRHLKAGKAKIKNIMVLSGAADELRFFN